MLVRHAEGLVTFEVADNHPLVKDTLRKQAAEGRCGGYPQYEGYWDGDEWRVVRFTKRVLTKMGVAFEPGDLALLRDPDPREVARYGSDVDHPTAYSFRNEVNTSVLRDSYEEVS